jgi:hypothetical protein
MGLESAEPFDVDGADDDAAWDEHAFLDDGDGACVICGLSDEEHDDEGDE